MVDELNDHDTPATTTSNSIPVTANESTNESVESGGSACVPASSFSASSATSQSNNGSSNQSLFEPSSSSSLNLTAGGDKVLTTPAVRRLATEHNVNLQDVQPTGKDGRVLKEDVLRHLEQLQPQSQNGTNCSASAATRITNKEPASPTVVRTSTTARTVRTGSTLSGKASLPALLESDQVHRLKGVQKAMAKSMTAALRIPHFGLSDELNLSKLVKLRAQLKKQVEQRGVHLSYLPFFVKAASLALRQYPMLNATFDAENEQLVYRASHNIGVAVDSPSGLVVPNVKNVQNLSILEIAQQLNHLTGLAANGQLSNNDMTGGTFTLSNIGSVSDLFKRLVNEQNK